MCTSTDCATRDILSSRGSSAPGSLRPPFDLLVGSGPSAAERLNLTVSGVELLDDVHALHHSRERSEPLPSSLRIVGQVDKHLRRPACRPSHRIRNVAFPVLLLNGIVRKLQLPPKLGDLGVFIDSELDNEPWLAHG